MPSRSPSMGHTEDAQEEGMVRRRPAHLSRRRRCVPEVTRLHLHVLAELVDARREQPQIKLILLGRNRPHLVRLRVQLAEGGGGPFARRAHEAHPLAHAHLPHLPQVGL
eukprot:scaffold118057_cov63-Phaeocystis_antarctica.AAC.2